MSPRLRVLARAAGLGAVLALPAWWACRPTPPLELRVATPHQLTTLDPHALDWISHTALLANLYEPLVCLDPEMRLQPCLAESWESPDPLTWVFRLREGVSFDGGRPLRAADVVFTIRRLLGHADLQMSTYVSEVAEVVALDERRVRLRTRQPTRVLLNKLASVAIVPEGADGTLASLPVGTGPYRLAGPWDRKGALRLVRRPGHWAGEPEAATLDFDLGRSPDESIRGLREGRYQLIQCNSRRIEPLASGFEVLRLDNISVKHLGFDVAREVSPGCSVRPNPFRSLAVRQAVRLAVDRPRLAGGLESYASPIDQGVPRFVFGFDPKLAAPGHDVERARALLRQAGLDSGFQVTMLVAQELAEPAGLVRRDLEAVGIRLDLEVLSEEEHGRRLARGEGTLWMDRFSCATGDASDLLNDLVHSRDPASHHGAFNYGGYRNPDLDRRIERSLGIEDPAERLRELQSILRLALGELSWLPLYEDQDVYALDRSLTWSPRRDGALLGREVRRRAQSQGP